MNSTFSSWEINFQVLQRSIFCTLLFSGLFKIFVYFDEIPFLSMHENDNTLNVKHEEVTIISFTEITESV